MDPLNLFSYIMIGILVFAAVCAGAVSVKDEIVNSRIRKANDEKRRLAQAKEWREREQIRRDNPTSSSGDDTAYIAALAAAGYSPIDNTSGDGGGSSTVSSDSSSSSDGGSGGGGE